MSVINQVLNQLDKRGVQSAAPQVRPVQVVRNYHGIRALIALLVGLLMAAVVFWRLLPVPTKVVALTPASAPTRAAPVAPVMPPLASRLSFELSSVPLPERPLTASKSEAMPGQAKPSMPEVRQIPVATTPPGSLPVKQISQAQQVDAEYRRANASMLQGRTADAIAAYEGVLRSDVNHDAARQALVALLLEGGRARDAEQVLQDGLKNKPGNSGQAMWLARLQVEHGELDLALATLDATLPHAAQLADYQAFYAALLQRKGRHGEAAEHYQLALKSSPDKGVWLMGYGISLQALLRLNDAKEAYRHALESRTLSPELQAFVQQKINKL
ncbi:MAG: tetratricopeptide repeat protein [Gallionella sp.]|nr:tetratricopeptide repeat protein [Gallionella sp.]